MEQRFRLQTHEVWRDGTIESTSRFPGQQTVAAALSGFNVWHDVMQG